MSKFRFFITSVERPVFDSVEEIAMLRHRLKSIAYLSEKITNESVDYIFKSEDNRTTYIQMTAETPEELDSMLKLDPIWDYSSVTVTPVITTSSLISELQSYLGENQFTEEEAKSFDVKSFEINNEGQYSFIIKDDIMGREVVGEPNPTRGYSPLVSVDDLKKIHKKTLVSQSLHQNALELSDVNPIGVPTGILLVSTQSESEINSMVSEAAIYPHTEVQIKKINTLSQSQQHTISRLNTLDPSDEIFK